MNAERMMEIAGQLSALYRRRAEISLREWQAGKDLAARELVLTPPEGWPGKNQEARDLAREQAFKADEAHSQILAQTYQAHIELVEIEGQVEGLEAERRALEWQIRARLVEALERKHIQGNHHGEAAFEDVSDHTMDEALFDGPGMAPVDDDELPF